MTHTYSDEMKNAPAIVQHLAEILDAACFNLTFNPNSSEIADAIDIPLKPEKAELLLKVLNEVRVFARSKEAGVIFGPGSEYFGNGYAHQAPENTIVLTAIHNVRILVEELQETIQNSDNWPFLQGILEGQGYRASSLANIVDRTRLNRPAPATVLNSFLSDALDIDTVINGKAKPSVTSNIEVPLASSDAASTITNALKRLMRISHDTCPNNPVVDSVSAVSIGSTVCLTGPDIHNYLDALKETLEDPQIAAEINQACLPDVDVMASAYIDSFISPEKKSNARGHR